MFHIFEKVREKRDFCELEIVSTSLIEFSCCSTAGMARNPDYIYESDIEDMFSDDDDETVRLTTTLLSKLTVGHCLKKNSIDLVGVNSGPHEFFH